MVPKQFQEPHRFTPDAGSDMVILVIGLTGAGKSTFINKLLGEECMKVGHTMDPCTAELDCAVVKPGSIPYPHPSLEGRRVVMVDTPGFDNLDTLPDERIIHKIQTWLKTSYHKKMAFAGVVYLHDISHTRYFAECHRVLGMLKRLCGNSAHRVVLGTTKWGTIPAEEEAMHEKELKEGYWQSMIAGGSQVRKFEGSQESALKFIDILLLRQIDGGNAIDGIATIEEMDAAGRVASRVNGWQRFVSRLRTLGRRLF